MNHTTSSLAKSSRSTSVGEGLQTRTPPDSPDSHKKRKLCEEVQTHSSLHCSSSLSTSLSLTFSHPVSPIRLNSNPPPSRIPLRKQPLSPSRSLCLEGRSRSSVSGASGYEVTLNPGSSGQSSREPRRFPGPWNPALVYDFEHFFAVCSSCQTSVSQFGSVFPRFSHREILRLREVFEYAFSPHCKTINYSYDKKKNKNINLMNGYPVHEQLKWTLPLIADF